MPCEYAHGLYQLPVPVVSLVEGQGQFSTGGTLNLYLQGRNRAGYTIPSEVVSITHTSTQAIAITLPTLNRTALDFHYYIISHSPTGEPEDAYQLFEWRNYELDQLTLRELAPVMLYKNEHIAIEPSGGAPIVATPNNLPSGTNLLPGMVRYVIGTTPSAHYRHDPFEIRPSDGAYILEPVGNEKWIRFGNPSTGNGNPIIGTVTNVFSLGGCAQPVQAVDPLLAISAPGYAADPDPTTQQPQKGTPIKVSWRNNTGSPLPAGTTFRIDVFHGKQNKSYLYAQKLLLTVHGYVDPADGTLDISDMTNIDGDITWDGTRFALVLEKDLPNAQALFISIAPYFTRYQFGEEVLDGTAINFLLTPWAQAGEPAHGLWLLLQDTVFPVSGKLRVLPSDGASVIVLGGSALVKRFMFPERGSLTLGGLTPGVDDQKITLDGNGNFFVYSPSADVPNTDALRALIDMGVGYSNPSDWSNQITTTGSIEVTLTYPCDDDGYGTIRSDYPTIGGDTNGKFNPTQIQLYVLRVSDGKIFKLATLIGVLAQEQQTIIISNLTGATEVEALPSASSSDFGLFDPPTVALALTSGGSLSGSYQVAATYYYSGNTITAISHDTGRGCIKELSTNLIDAVNAVSGISPRDIYLINLAHS